MDKIRGLHLQKDILDKEMEKNIIEELDTKEWSKSISRRTQHYGWVYNYSNRQANKKAPPFPSTIKHISDFLEEQNIIKAEQCIVNEYKRNQNISKHIDAPRTFGPVIVSVSLGEDTNIIFKKFNETLTLFVPRRSILIMKDEARYNWTHEIPKCATVTLENGEKVQKSGEYRRVSLTFRTMK